VFATKKSSAATRAAGHVEKGSRLSRNLVIKLAATGGVVAVGVGAMAGGVFANFTDSQAAGPTPITTGIVHIALSTPSGDHGALTMASVSPLAEGDTLARVVDLTNSTTVGAAGTTGLASLTLQSAPTGTNAASDIVTDTTNGLQVLVQSCATAPTETGGTTGPFSYTCSGSFTTVVTEALKTLDTTPITLTAPIEGASTYYVITETLPTTYADAYSYGAGVCSTGGVAGSTEQLMNCSLSVAYNFTATQRAGTAQ
jgi:spore coat-associated protein N